MAKKEHPLHFCYHKTSNRIKYELCYNEKSFENEGAKYRLLFLTFIIAFVDVVTFVGSGDDVTGSTRAGIWTNSLSTDTSLWSTITWILTITFFNILTVYTITGVSCLAWASVLTNYQSPFACSHNQIAVINISNHSTFKCVSKAMFKCPNVKTYIIPSLICSCWKCFIYAHTIQKEIVLLHAKQCSYNQTLSQIFANKVSNKHLLHKKWLTHMHHRCLYRYPVSYYRHLHQDTHWHLHSYLQI